MEQNENRNLTVKEMSEYLKIGITNAYQLIHKPGFPAVKITQGKFIIPKKSLDKWLEEQAGKVDAE